MNKTLTKYLYIATYFSTSFCTVTLVFHPSVLATETVMELLSSNVLNVVRVGLVLGIGGSTLMSFIASCSGAREIGLGTESPFLAMLSSFFCSLIGGLTTLFIYNFIPPDFFQPFWRNLLLIFSYVIAGNFLASLFIALHYAASKHK